MGTDDSLAPEALLAALLAAMDSAGIGCTVVIDREGSLRRAYSNTPVARMLGMTVDELQQTPPLLALTPEERERLSQLVRRGPGRARGFTRTRPGVDTPVGEGEPQEPSQQQALF